MKARLIAPKPVVTDMFNVQPVHINYGELPVPAEWIVLHEFEIQLEGTEWSEAQTVASVWFGSKRIGDPT